MTMTSIALIAVPNTASAGFRNKVLGCWIGKNCGGTLGAPLEECYGRPEPFDAWWYPRLQEGGIPNDDLEIQLIWLKALEELGPGLRSADLAQYWLDHICYNWDEYGVHRTNLRLGLTPPVSGAFNNWFKDCMGCPIRCEVWACVAPGAPRVAVKYAFEDAILDHAGGESVYGEMFNTAIESAGFVVSDTRTLIDIGLSYVPKGSKTSLAIRAALDAYDAGLTWQEARQRSLDAAPHYNAQYSPLNMAFQVIGWLWGTEFGDALCKAVNCGYDTDCTGATLGSYLGIVGGADSLPARWTEPLGETIATNESWGGLKLLSAGNNPVPTDLQSLTDRVCRMAAKVLAHHGIREGSEIAIEDLYADDEARSLWSAPPMQCAWTVSGLNIAVDYGTNPTISAGQARKIVTTIRNPHPVALAIESSLRAPEGWSVEPATAAVTAPENGETSVEWTVSVASPIYLNNSNRLRLDVHATDRPAIPSVPVVLIGARRYQVTPLIAGASDQDLFDREFAPETAADIFAQSGRSGDWADYRVPTDDLELGDVLAPGGAVYVRFFLWSETERVARVHAAVNCPVKIWFNGEVAASSFEYRRIRPHYDETQPRGIEASFRAGWNEVLLKLVRGAKAAAFEGHVVLCDKHRHREGLVDVTWTRTPWDH